MVGYATTNCPGKTLTSCGATLGAVVEIWMQILTLKLPQHLSFLGERRKPGFGLSQENRNLGFLTFPRKQRAWKNTFIPPCNLARWMLNHTIVKIWGEDWYGRGAVLVEGPLYEQRAVHASNSFNSFLEFSQKYCYNKFSLTLFFSHFYKPSVALFQFISVRVTFIIAVYPCIFLVTVGNYFSSVECNCLL